MKRLGLVGCGYWGKNYVRTIRDMPDLQLTTIQDLKNPSILIPEGIKYTDNVADVLEDPSIDGVVIATPVETHYGLVRKALEHGKHVLVEKPMTNSSRDARELCDLAEKKNVVLMVGHIFKYNAGVQEMKKRIDSGEIGEIKYMDSRRVGLGPIRRDASALWDLASHDVYIFSHLTGQSPQTVSNNGESHNHKIDDVSQLTLRFKKGIFASIYANWAYPIKERRIIIGGTKKAIVFDDMEPSEKIRVYDSGVDYKTPEATDFGGFQATTREGDILIPKLKLSQPLEEELRHFGKCIEGKEKCKSDGKDGLQTVRILEAADLSRSNKGEEITIG